MNYCKFCLSDGRFPVCACGFGEILDCDGKLACADCAAAHRKTFGPFFRALLGTKAATRSNSPRTKLLNVLMDFLGSFGEDRIKNRVFIFDMLHKTSVFDENDRNFRYRVLRIAPALPLTKQFAAELSRRLDSVRIERVLEVMTEITRAKIDRENEARAVCDFLTALVGSESAVCR